MASRLQDVILRDTRANQPLATDVASGTVYYVTDEQVTERASDTATGMGGAWEDISDGGGGGGGINQLTGDVTAGPGSGSQAATLANTAVTPGTYGDASNVPQITIDSKGRITAAVDVPVAGGSGITQLTGDVTAGPGSGSQAATIANDAIITAKILDANVTLAKIANIATDRILGRDTAGSGVIEELSLGASLEFSGSGSIQRAALTGDVTAAANSNATTIANNAITTAKILDANVTLAKLANIATDSLIGRDTAGSGVPENILLNATLSMDGSGNLRRAALTGDVTASAGSNSTTIANDAVITAKILDNNVTLAKLTTITTDRLLGRDTAGTGNVEEIALATSLEFSGSGSIQRSALTGDVTASAGSNATTIANNAVTTAKILDANVTYAKIQDVSAASKLLGRGSAGGSGDVEEITLGTGLSMSGTTLSATAAGLADATITADGDMTLAVNTVYKGTIAGYTADRTATLPTTFSIGDEIWIILNTGDADFEMLITAGSGDTLNGIAGGTEWSRIFITNEYIGMRATAADTWEVIADGRIPMTARLRLSTAADGEAANTNTLPTDAGGAWTVVFDNANMCVTATGRIIMRRACRTFAVVNLRAKDNVVANGSYTALIFASGAERARMLISASATYVNIPAGCSSFFESPADDYIQALYQSSAGGIGVLNNSLCNISVLESLMR